VKQAHAPEAFDIEYSITDHPKWKLTNIPLSQLNLDPDGEAQDPYNRVNWVDDDKVQELIPRIGSVLKSLPIVVDSEGWIIDGNHRAVAAAEAGLTSVPAYVPVNPVVAEGKIKLYTDPGYFGAEVDDAGFDSLPIVNISADRVVGFEPDSKMQQPKSQANVKKIVAGLKKGDKLPPLLVRKYKNGYQVLDGHHRFWAYKLSGTKSIPVRIVADKDIEEIGKQGVAEGTESKITVKPSPGKGNGLFATNLIKAGEVITSSKFEPISDKDWQLIKDTTPVKLYGFKLGDKHALQSGPFKFKFNDQKEKALWDKTEFKGLSLSGFMFINGADSPDEVNSKENFSGNTAEMIATKDIQPGKEIIKQYNVPTKAVAENFADGENPVKFTVSSPDGYQHSFQITLAVHGKHVGHFNFVRSADTDDVNNEAEVEQRWQGQGYGKLLLMKAIDVANNHGLDFQQDIRGITDAQQNVYDSLENAGLIVTPGDGFWFLTPQGEQELNGLNENFADGKNPGRKGLSKRVGVNTKASVSSLRKTAKNSSGEKQRMAHWLANMKAGREKARRK
jgi:GNAT superfamily N-acetyltransferase